MGTLTIVNDLYVDLWNGIHNASSHNFGFVLGNTAPGSESSDPTANGNGQLSNVTQISYTNYSDDLTTDRRLENFGVSQGVGGQASVDFDDFVITASGGALATFQYVYFYNDSASNDELIAVYDEGSAVSLADTNTYTLTINASGLIRSRVAD